MTNKLQMEYVNLKFIQSRNVTQVILEIDSIYNEKITDTIGTPGKSLWVKIEPIIPETEILRSEKGANEENQA